MKPGVSVLERAFQLAATARYEIKRRLHFVGREFRSIRRQHGEILFVDVNGVEQRATNWNKIDFGRLDVDCPERPRSSGRIITE